MEKKNVGQIVQVARGNLLARLSRKALAYGELFVHTDGTTAVSSDITDLVTGAKIKKIFKGDLFAGDNSLTKVYAVGSGGALKWGGILFSGTTYAEAVARAQNFPNFVFMYNGTETLYSHADTPGREDKISVADSEMVSGTNCQPDEVTKSYVADESKEWTQDINPGDLIFYSPALEQIVVLHLGRSSDALTKINVDALISNSMKDLLAENENNVDSTATLKKFLDGPVRHYQYLIDEQGWAKVNISTQCDITTNEDGEKTISTGEATLPKNLKDGEIYYVPFDSDHPGLCSYAVTACGKTEIVREGDLIFILPTDDGKVTWKVQSLFAGLLSQLNSDKTFNRADEYATDVWNADENDSDPKFFEKQSGLMKFIERLFTTKVDIDPVTKKIIASQLPDYLLGAPKYMGTCSSPVITTHIEKVTDPNGQETSVVTTALKSWEELFSETTTAYTFAQALDGKWQWDNIDGNADTDSTDKSKGGSEKEDSDTKLQTGCYWIYNGASINIEGFPGIFNLGTAKDDYVTGDDAKREEHRLEKGDWIVYNGETDKFDILDNSSSFLGLLVNGYKLAGIVEFKSDSVTTANGNKYFSDNDAEFKNFSKDLDDLDISASNQTVNFNNKNKILNPGTTFLDSNHIPVVGVSDANGNAPIVNSGFHYVNVAGKPGYGLGTVLKDDTNTLNVDLIWHLLTEGYENSEARLWANRGKNDAKRYINVTQGENGFDFGKFDFSIEDKEYIFDLDWATDLKLALPNYSGILTTEEYVNRGFDTVRDIITDMYDTLTTGTIDWLQTVKEENGKKLITDSNVKQTVATDRTKLYLDLFYDAPVDKTKDTGKFGRLSVLENLKPSTNAKAGMYDAPVDCTVNLPEGGTKVYNPSTPEAGTIPENILPNHSGVLLNNNSVIDGGEWTLEDN